MQCILMQWIAHSSLSSSQKSLWGRGGIADFGFCAAISITPTFNQIWVFCLNFNILKMHNIH